MKPMCKQVLLFMSGVLLAWACGTVGRLLAEHTINTCSAHTDRTVWENCVNTHPYYILGNVIGFNAFDLLSVRN